MTHGHRDNFHATYHQRNSGRIPRRSAGVAALALACCAALAGARAQETQDAPVTDAVADRQTKLLAERNELILSANRAYQTEQYDDAMRRLEQLVDLYTQIYPVSEYPNGHIGIIQAYLSMCDVAEARKEFIQLMNVGEVGLHACRTLCPNHDDAEANAAEVLLHNYVGKACRVLGDLAKSRQHFMQAAEICRPGLNHDPNGAMHLLIADAHDCLAQISMTEGDVRAAEEYWSLAATAYKYRLQMAYTPHEQRQFAQYLFSRSNALRHLGNYVSSLKCAKEANEISLRLLLVTRSQEDYVNTFRSLLEQGALLRDLGDMEGAYNLLENVRCKLQSNPDHDLLYPGMLDAVLCNLLAIAVAERDQRELEFCRDALRCRHSFRPGQLPLGRNAIENAELMRNLGYAFRESGDYSLAEHYYEKALDLLSCDCLVFAGSLMDLEMTVVRHDRALLYDDMGRYHDAYTEYAESLRVARRLFPVDKYPCGHPLLSRVMQNMATHCWLVGETQIAADLYHQVVAMNESLFPDGEFPNGHPRLQEAYSAWSDVLMRERRLDEAEIYAAKSHDLIVKSSGAEAMACPRRHDDLAGSWISLGRLRRARGDYAAAKELFGQALESYESRYSGDDAGGQWTIALVLAELGRTAAAERSFSTALDFHRRSLAIRRGLFPQSAFPVGHPSLANALRDLGITCLDAGEPAEAFGLLAESVGMEHAIGESFFGGGSEAQLLNLAARKFQSLGPLLQAWQQTELPADEVYQYVWMRHGFVPQLIADRQRALRELARETEPASYEKYVTVRQDLARILLVSVTDDTDRNAARLDRIRQLSSIKEDLEQQLTRGLEATRSGLHAAEDVRTLVSVLPERSVFVDFFSFSTRPYDATVPSRSNHHAANRIVAFVVGRDLPIACVDVGESGEIATLIAAWNTELSTADSGSAGTALREKIWDPICRHFPDDLDTIYIAPDGMLADVAWSALPCPTDSGVLLEHYAIAIVPHGPFLLDRLQESTLDRRPFVPVLAVGDVDYGDPEGNATAAPEGLKRLTWEKLAGSRRELEAIASCVNAPELTLLTGSQATAENVLKELSLARVAHFATHGFFLDDDVSVALDLAGADSGPTWLTANRTRSSVLGRSPLLRSGLALAGANAPTARDDLGIPIAAHGILTAESIAAMDGRDLQLVVLSACDTTRGDIAVGDGVLGLQSAFHIAGVRNVIAGLWKVSDQPTAELMSDFYMLLWDRQLTPLLALREAQLNMLRRGRPNPSSSRSPGPELSKTIRLDMRPTPASNSRRVRDWAGFVLSGPGF